MERKAYDGLLEKLDAAAEVFAAFCQTIEPESNAARATSNFLRATELEIKKDKFEQRSEKDADLDLVLRELALLRSEHTKLRTCTDYIRAYHQTRWVFNQFLGEVGELSVNIASLVIERANLEFEHAIAKHKAP